MNSFMFSFLLCHLVLVTYETPTDDQFQQLLESVNQLKQLTAKQDMEIDELKQQLQSGIADSFVKQESRRAYGTAVSS